MNRTLRRTIGVALLGLCLAGAFDAIAKQAAPDDAHACCGGRAGSTTAPTPCEGFLPLTCCDGAALPGTEARSAPHAAPILALATALPPSHVAPLAPASPAPAKPSLLPARSSTVLQL